MDASPPSGPLVGAGGKGGGGGGVTSPVLQVVGTLLHPSDFPAGLAGGGASPADCQVQESRRGERGLCVKRDDVCASSGVHLDWPLMNENGYCISEQTELRRMHAHSC